MTTTTWSGDEWQEYCCTLLSLRHGEEFQRVPDRVRGDWGIEGFAGGILYQCFAPEEPLSTADRYKKQRDKITADLEKLASNLAEIRPLVQPTDIECWVLLVPQVDDKRILTHAAKKAAQFRGRNLGGISSQFRLRVLTDEDFPNERAQLTAGLAIRIPSDGSPTNQEIESLAASVPVEDLDRKLFKVVRDGAAPSVVKLRGEFLALYLSGEALAESLRQYYPILWEDWNRAEQQVRATLKMTELTSTSSPPARLQDVISALEQTVGAEIPSIRPTDRQALALGAVADWLIECSLDFAGADDG